ncbi:MAG: hypothetical protein VKI83_06630 [Synechococcaceae cyanobacterium]|nr:hypothetical protein [Synechococcaceae cyanobacterium]
MSTTTSNSSMVSSLLGNAKATRMRVRSSLQLTRSVLQAQLLRLPPEAETDRCAVYTEMRLLDRCMDQLSGQEAA